MRDQAIRIVCNIRIPQENGSKKVGTGSFVVKENDLYFVTASHVSVDVNASTYIA